MPVYWVLVNGSWSDGRRFGQAKGFSAARTVWAVTEERAITKAFAMIERDWLRNYASEAAHLPVLQAEEVQRSNWAALFQHVNRGHAFYERDD